MAVFAHPVGAVSESVNPRCEESVDQIIRRGKAGYEVAARNDQALAAILMGAVMPVSKGVDTLVAV